MAASKERRTFSAGIPSMPALAWSNSLTRSVSMRPGQTVLTKIPRGPSSSARVFISPATPARMVLERIKPGIGCFTEEEAMARMRPPWGMWGNAVRTRRTTLSRLVSKAFCQAASSKDSRVPPGGPPALQRRMSIFSQRFTVSWTTPSISSRFDTSAASPTTSAPVFPAISEAASWTRSALRLHMTTRAPSSASFSAMARPKPRLAAVTNAVFPFNPRSIRHPASLIPLGFMAAHGQPTM